MSTTSTGSETRPRLGLRVRLGLALGLLAGLLCVVLSFAIGARARDAARTEANRYLARLAMEYREALQRDGKLDAGGPASRRAARGRSGAGLDLSSARKSRAAIEASADPALPVELMLVGRDGTVLVGPEDLEGAILALPGNGPAAVRGRDGQLYLVAASAAPPAQGSAAPVWSTFARTRADLAFAPATALQRDILWAGLLLALAGIAAGWVLGTRHALPLEALTRAAQEIVRGNDRAELPSLDDSPEIERLAQALRAMLLRLRMQAASLEDAQQHLQRRVHERTAALVKLQAELQLEVAEAKLARDDLARAHEELASRLGGRSREINQERARQ